MPITVKRLSDGQDLRLMHLNENSKVAEVKTNLKASLPPKFEHGKLIFILFEYIEKNIYFILPKKDVNFFSIIKF